MNNTMNNTNDGHATAETILRQMAQDLAAKIGESYASVKIEAYADGRITWTCYTAKTRHTYAPSFADALAAQFDHTSNAAKLREDAAALLARADAMEAAK